MKLLIENLQNLAGKMVELRAGCPTWGCGVGRDGELFALWRRWTSLRRCAGLLLAHNEQKEEEWKDITTSVSVIVHKFFQSESKGNLNKSLDSSNKDSLCFDFL